MSYIYGRNSVIESLKSSTPPQKIFISFNSQGSSVNTIYKLAQERKVQTVKWDRGKFGALERDIGINAKSSQGVIALGKIGNTMIPEELIANALESEHPLIVVLDEIKDVHNLGAIARTAAALGSQGIIVPERNSAPVSPATVKISAGVLNTFPVASSTNMKQTLDYAKAEGFEVIGTDMEESDIYYKKEYKKPLILVIGSEEKGIHPSVRTRCDGFVSIPMNSTVESFNASVAAGIILSEIARQRNNQ
jgi:23S rRNA (guanosine2251-2'-O)-methyltransferase